MGEQHLGCSYVTAAVLIQQPEGLKILREITGRQRNRLFRYDPYLALFDHQALSLLSAKETQNITITMSEEAGD